MKKKAPEGAEEIMHLEGTLDGMEAELGFMDAILGGDDDLMADVPEAVRRDLALFSELEAGPCLPLEAFVPAAPTDAPPLPPELEARLLANIDDAPDAGLLGWLKALFVGPGIGRYAVGLAAVALVVIALPRQEAAVVKGPVDSAVAPVPLLGLHLVKRGGDGRIVRLPVEPLSRGGHGARVQPGEDLLPVFQSPEAPLDQGRYYLYTFVGAADGAWQLGDALGPVPMDALPGTAHLYAAPEPVRFTPDGPGDRRLSVVLSPKALTEAEVARALDRLAGSAITDGRPSLMIDGPQGALEASLRVEVR